MWGRDSVTLAFSDCSPMANSRCLRLNEQILYARAEIQFISPTYIRVSPYRPETAAGDSTMMRDSQSVVLRVVYHQTPSLVVRPSVTDYAEFGGVRKKRAFSGGHRPPRRDGTYDRAGGTAHNAAVCYWAATLRWARERAADCTAVSQLQSPCPAMATHPALIQRLQYARQRCWNNFMGKRRKDHSSRIFYNRLYSVRYRLYAIVREQNALKLYGTV